MLGKISEEVSLTSNSQNEGLIPTLRNELVKRYKIESIGLSPSKTNMPNSIAADLTVKVKRKENVQNILKEVNKIENVNFAIIKYSIEL